MSQHKLSVVTEAVPGQKRTAPGPEDGPDAKKAQCAVDPKLIVQQLDIKKALLFESKVSGIKGGVSFQIRDSCCVLVNTSNAEVTIPRLTVLGGWGKGTFKLRKVDEPVPTKGVSYTFKDEQDIVLLGGAAQTLGTCITTQRAKIPAAEPCYHKLSVDPQNPAKFTLKQTHSVWFVPAADQSDHTKENNICLRAVNLDDVLGEVTSVAWMVRWTMKGLQAVMPKLVLIKAVVLPPGSALIVSGTIATQ
jgi:hypothetical protein